ncbi:MAG TPA: hypothetical protein VEI02_06110 [Planctomycetota bacterium]|nr:hypothetical protein [Planctomycetota bacterium]
MTSAATPASPPARGRAGAALAAATAAALAALIYAPYLDLGFYADDFGQLREIRRDVERGAFPGLASARASEEDGRVTLALWRPVLEGINAGLMATAPRDDAGRVARPDPRAEHAASIAARALLCALVVGVARRLGASPTAALLGGVLSAVHPGPSNAVLWIAARGDLLWPAFTLAAALAAIPPAGRAGGRGRVAVALALYALALGSKETAVIGGIAVAAAFVAGARRGGWTRGRATAGVVGTLALVGGYLALRRALFGAAAAAYPNVDPEAPIASLARAALGAARPTAMRLFGGRSWSQNDPLWAVALAVAATAAVAATVVATTLAALRRPRRPSALFTLALGALSLFPVPLQPSLVADVMFGRLLVGWTAALALAAATTMDRAPAVRKASVVSAALLAANFMVDRGDAFRWHASFDAPRRSVAEAVEAAPGVLALIVPPRAAPAAPLIPDWSTLPALAPPFLPPDVAVLRFASDADFEDLPDPSAPGRPVWATSRPLVVARGGYDLDAVLRFRTSTFPAFDAAAPSTRAARLEDGGAAAVFDPPPPPRAYPALTFEVDASAAGATLFGEGDLRRGPLRLPTAWSGPRRFALWRDGPDASVERLRLEPPEGAASRPMFRSAELRRERALLAIVEPASGATWSLSAPAPRLRLADGAGWPHLRLHLTVESARGAAQHDVTRRFEAGLVGEEARTLSYDLGADPSGPAAMLRFAGARLFEGAEGEVRLIVSASTSAAPDGPPLARAAPITLLLRP